MITYQDCPNCGARKIHSTVRLCEVCETWERAEQALNAQDEVLTAKYNQQLARAEKAERQRDTAREEVERLLSERNAAFDDNARLRLALRSCADIGEARVAKVVRDALTQDFEKPGEAVVTAGDLIGLRRR